MEFRFPMSKIMGTSFDEDTLSNPTSPKKSRAPFCSDSICHNGNTRYEYDPDSLKKAFHPLGTFSKCFGLFPCYDFAFVENLNERGVRVIHILDYCYSALIFLLLTGGAILCFIFKPRIIQTLDTSNNNNSLDYYVKTGMIFATIFTGIQSLFIFPMKWSNVLDFVKLISNIDKILKFDGRKQERCFANKVLFYLLGCLFFTLGSFTVLFIYEGRRNDAPEPVMSDYLMAPIMTLALMAVVIPTGLAVFFLNAMRLRFDHFNRKMCFLLKPYIPSCMTCSGFSDYGNELNEFERILQKCNDKRGSWEDQQNKLAEDLEKMRILQWEIRTLGNCMNCIFGMHLVRDFLYSLVALVLYFYFLIYFNNEGQNVWIIYAGQTVFILLKIFVIVVFAQLLCCQALVLEGTLQRVSLRRLSPDASLQIQIFMGAMAKPPTISASGFFHINKALMTSILGCITTYFIILIQFKLNSGLFGANQNKTGSTAFD